MRIRVLREAGGIGDIVRAMVAVRGLREKYPAAEIWGYFAAPFVPLCERAGGCDRIIPMPTARRRPRGAAPDPDRWPEYRAPNGETFDLTVALYCPAYDHEVRAGYDQWLCRIDLMCRAADVEPRDKTPHLTPRAEDEAEADRALASLGLGAHAAGCAESSSPRLRGEAGRGVREDEELGRMSQCPSPDLSPFRGEEDRKRRPLIALQPFSTDPARDWSEANFRRLADVLRWRGWQVLVLDGCGSRTRAFDGPRLCGRPLGVVAAVLARCDLLIGPDSGLYHLAAAVGTPAVGIFGSQSAGITGRYYPRHTWVSPPDAFRCPNGAAWPCFWKRPPECARRSLHDAGRTCPALAAITVEEVYDAAAAWVRSPALAVPDGPPPAAGAFHDVEGVALARGILERRDRSCDSVLLVGGVNAVDFREAFRVLEVGGALWTAGMDEVDNLPGMRRVETRAGGLVRWEKSCTWPRQ